MLYFFPMPVASPLLQDKPILNADCLPRAQYYRPNHSLSCTDCCVWRSVPYVSCVCTACRGLLRLSSSLGSWYEQARIVQVFSQSTDKILTLRKAVERTGYPFPIAEGAFWCLLLSITSTGNFVAWWLSQPKYWSLWEAVSLFIPHQGLCSMQSHNWAQNVIL